MEDVLGNGGCVGERMDDDPGKVLSRVGRLDSKSPFLGTPFIVILEVTESVLRATERTELAEERTPSCLVGVS